MPEEPSTEPTVEEPAAAVEPADPATPPEGNDPWADPEAARKEIEKLRREAAAHRTKAKDRDALAARVAEFEQAQMSDQERVQARLAEAEQRAQRLQSRAVRAEVKALASAQFADADDAAAFLDLGSYVSADGEIDTAQIQADLADLLDRKPHLGRPPADGPRRPAPDRLQGSSGNHKPNSDPAGMFAGFLKNALQGR